MIRIQTPWPAATLDFFLPNPRYGDSLNDTVSTQLQYSMTGITRSLVRINQPQKLVWQFSLPKCAFDEFGVTRDYVNKLNMLMQSFTDADIRLTDWRAATWTVRLISNPIEFTMSKNFNDCVLEFRGTKDP